MYWTQIPSKILLSDSLPQLLVLLNLVYLLCNYSKGVVLHRRIVRADHIVMRAVRNTFCHAVVFISLITLVHFGSLSTRFLVIFYTAFLALLVLYRLIFRHFVKIYRRKEATVVLLHLWATAPIWSNSTKR